MAKTYAVPQNIQALVGGGLTPAQALIYETLIQQGSLNARRAGFIAGIPRTLAYKILGELEKLELVVKDDAPGKVAEFSATHPLKLQEMAEKRFAEARDAKLGLDGAIFKLISDFSKTSGQQGAQVLEGVSGLKELLEGQLAQKKPLMTTIIENSPAKLTLSVIFEPFSAE